MFKERWHPCSLGIGKLRSFTFIHQAITCIQPKFFVQILIGVYPRKGLHHPIYSCFTELVKRRAPIKTELPTHKTICSHVYLFITRNVCRYSPQSCVTIETEKGEKDEENCTLGHHRFEDRVIWMFNLCIPKSDGFGFSLLIHAQSVGDVTECEIMLFLVPDIGL